MLSTTCNCGSYVSLVFLFSLFLLKYASFDHGVSLPFGFSFLTTHECSSRMRSYTSISFLLSRNACIKYTDVYPAPISNTFSGFVNLHNWYKNGPIFSAPMCMSYKLVVFARNVFEYIRPNVIVLVSFSFFSSLKFRFLVISSFFVSSSIFSAYFISPKQNSSAMNSMTSFFIYSSSMSLSSSLSSSSFTSDEDTSNLSINTFSKSKTVLTSRSSNASSRYKQSSFLSASEIFIVVVSPGKDEDKFCWF
mmetsp:Transcript_4635/g.15029  ORF Transcript_4635/g.15029 Transcript_4635/m.15029 type:complete len:249 (+) Transcript_4635:499-1245(+)